MGTWNPIEAHAQKAQSVTAHGTMQYLWQGLCTRLQQVRAISIGYHAFIAPHATTTERTILEGPLRSLQCGYGMDLCASYEIVPPEGMSCLGC